MKTTFVEFSKSMVNTPTMLAHIREWVSVFLCLGQTQNGAQNVQSITEISWEASSTIPTGSLPLRFLAMDKVFTPYTVSLEEFAARNLACKKTRS